MTVGLQNLSNQNFYRIKSVVPPLHEQDQILDYVDENIAAVNAAQETIHKQIAAVKKYNSKLVADVVTGKLDVREFAQRLPNVEILFPPSELVEDEFLDEVEEAEEQSDADI